MRFTWPPRVYCVTEEPDRLRAYLLVSGVYQNDIVLPSGSTT